MFLSNKEPKKCVHFVYLVSRSSVQPFISVSSLECGQIPKSGMGLSIPKILFDYR